MPASPDITLTRCPWAGTDPLMIAYHDHNADRVRPGLIERMGREAVALVSDAGTPLISDPGYKLVSEAIELGSIGRLTMQRATSIEFDATTQQWEVRDAGGALLHTDASREVCLAWEHRHFNR